MAGSISRTHDGIPIFDGSPELLPLYKEEAVQYLMTFEYRKRYLAGPRLVKELQGTAKTAVRNMTLRNPQWVSHPRGVFVLLEHLEGIVAKPSLVEASRFIMKYFYGLQRKKFESMTGWVARHSEALWEASQALRKVQREYEPKKASTSERQDWYGQDTNSSRHSRPVSEHGPFRDDGRLDEEEDEGDERGADYEGQWNRRTSWDYGQNWSDWSYQSWHSAEYDPPETWDTSTEVFLPEFLVGFLLLHRSGLDTHERANVLAAIRGQFSPQTVARALREQWSDEDLNKRDRAKFGSALVVDQELEEDLEALMANDDEGDNINVQDLPAEEQEAYMSEQAKIDDALAAIRTQKTTLKEARWKQKQLKLGRGYYPPKPFQKGSSSSGFKKPSGSVGCFKCGGAHMARDCPNKRPDGDAKMAEESAEIAFGAMEMEESLFGSQVHWELSARCEAWKLPEIVDFLDRHQLEKVSCSGCAVGLRTTDKQKLLCKAWTIATRNKMMIRHMNLQCQKNHPKGKCEAGQTAHTARYTPSFVRRVVDCFGEHESWAQVVQELQQTRVEQGLAADDIVDVDEEPEEITEAEKKEIEAKIQHIHRATGHGSMKNLIASLQRRGSSAKVIQVARNWKCPTCAERKHQDPRRFATLNTIAAKWEVIEIDTATWVHPLTKKRYYFVLFVDSGSRFKVGKILHSPSARAASWETLKQAFEELWLPIFGKPKGIRVDPAGSWLNNEAETYFSNNNILYDPIPAEAHWQISAVEQGIKTIKGVMEALAQDFAELEVSEIFGRSIWVCNNQEIYKGFSPLQHALGRAPDDHQRLFECDDVKPIHPDILADGGFKEDAKIRCQAEKAFAEEQAKRRLERAARMGHRRSQVYIPGDLVYYWRRQLQPADRTSFQTGKFLGPARVIATETRREEDGTLRPGSVVWLHRGGRLIRSAPEQLRKASPYEQQIEELQGPIELPWTITSLATDPKRRTYVDISGDLPDEHEWETDLAFPPEEPGKELAVPTKRFREKGSPAMTDTSQKSRRQNLPKEQNEQWRSSTSGLRLQQAVVTDQAKKVRLTMMHFSWQRYPEKPMRLTYTFQRVRGVGTSSKQILRHIWQVNWREDK